HIEREVTPGEAAEILPRIGACYDEPFADPSAVPTWYLSKIAAEHVKVVLSGDGGDEMFAGYTRHYNERVVSRLSKVPGLLPVLGAVADLLPPLPGAAANDRKQWLQRVCDNARLPDALARFFSKTQIASPRFRSKLYSAEFLAQFPPEEDFATLRREIFPKPISRDPVEELLYGDITVRLPNVMLTKVDRASMAHSLEVRVPFLSHRLADWAAGVPIDMKLRGRIGKYLVRRAIEPWLPQGFLDRPKQGFSIPLADWFRGDLGTYAESLWEDSRAYDSGYLDRSAVRQVFRDHRVGRFDHSQFLYALAMFSIWWTNRATSAR
ncbi:MAG: asparagine synthetase B, partial [Alphaproteobacteria bacterium]|nr:asparagine synthetase B [Alphaproteobacteria bacterium]